MITRAAIDVDGFTKASNYLNNKGEHPKILTAIVYNEIVLNPKDLTDDKWLYTGEEEKSRIEWQLDELNTCKDFVALWKE